MGHASTNTRHSCTRHGTGTASGHGNDRAAAGRGWEEREEGEREEGEVEREGKRRGGRERVNERKEVIINGEKS